MLEFRPYQTGRRHQFGAVLVAVMVLLAGCGALGGNRTPETITDSASQATVNDAALSASGFAETTVEDGTLTDSGTLDVSGDVELEVNYRIEATTKRAIYTRGNGTQSVFAVYSVPLVEPDDVDAQIDPLGGRSTTELANRAQDTYEEFGDLDHVENTTVTMLGNQTTLAKYATTARADSGEVDVYVYITRVHHAGDVIVAVAVVPQEMDDPAAVQSLIENVEH